MEEMLAVIKFFAGNFAPRGFMFCQGQTLAISTNTALFSLLGTTYGGDGVTTFRLPDFRGRIPVGTGQGPGTSNYQLGQIAGTENTTLLVTNMPAHTHQATATSTLYGESVAGDDNTPGGNLLANSSPAGTNIYTQSVPNPNQSLASDSISTTVTIGTAGGSQPFSILSPYLAMNYIICVEGIFPSRN